MIVFFPACRTNEQGTDTNIGKVNNEEYHNKAGIIMQGHAEVRYIRVSAQFFQGNHWRWLSVGQILPVATVVKTAAGSQIALYLDQNGPVVLLNAQTELTVNGLTFVDTVTRVTRFEILLTLTSGRILGSVLPLSAARKYLRVS